MAKFKIRFTNRRELQKRIDKINPKINSRIVSKSLVECAMMIARNAVSDQIIRSADAGVVNKKRLTNRTTTLIGSMGTATKALNKSGLPRYIDVGSNVEYAAIHEYGGENMPKRPYLAPALDDVSGKFEDVFLKHWRIEAGI